MAKEEGRQQFRCTGDCLQCSRVQREYCAAQHSYHAYMMVSRALEEIEKIKRKVDDIQGSEALVFSTGAGSDMPMVSIAQEGDGAEE